MVRCNGLLWRIFPGSLELPVAQEVDDLARYLFRVHDECVCMLDDQMVFHSSQVGPADGHRAVMRGRQDHGTHGIDPAVARDDAKLAIGYRETRGEAMRSGTELGRHGAKKDAEQAPPAETVNDLTAPVWWGKHDDPAKVARSVFSQICPKNQAPQRMGDEVNFAGAIGATPDEFPVYFSDDRLDRVRPARIGEVVNSVAGVRESTLKELHGPWAPTESVQKNYRIGPLLGLRQSWPRQQK